MLPNPAVRTARPVQRRPGCHRPRRRQSSRVVALWFMV